MKSAQGSAERAPVQNLGDRLEIAAALALAHSPHDAGRDAGAERHAHEGAGFELKPGWRAIAVGGVDRDGDEHVDRRLR